MKTYIITATSYEFAQDKWERILCATTSSEESRVITDWLYRYCEDYIERWKNFCFNASFEDDNVEKFHDYLSNFYLPAGVEFLPVLGKYLYDLRYLETEKVVFGCKVVDVVSIDLISKESKEMLKAGIKSGKTELSVNLGSFEKYLKD